MRVMVLIRSDQSAEAGVLPDEKYVGQMLKYNEELVKAGVMLAAEGLHPSSKAKRVKFSGGKVTVIDGPFTEAKELVAGFWLWQVKSLDEAVEWVKRMPSPDQPPPGGEGVIEIRQVFEMDEFGATLTPELKQQEQGLRAQAEAKSKRS